MLNNCIFVFSMSKVIKNIKVIICLLSLLGSQTLNAQTARLNHLKQELNDKVSVSTKREILIKICDQNYSMSSDGLLNYIRLGEQITTRGSIDFIRFELFRIAYLSKTGNSTGAILLSDSLLMECKQYVGDLALFQKINIEKCRAYIRNYQNKEGIELVFKILQNAEKMKDTSTVVLSYTILGWANMELENYSEAIKWLEKGIGFTNNPKYLIMHPAILVNLASCYNNVFKIEPAFKNIELGLLYARKSENLICIANALNVRADMYIKQKNIKAAQIDLEEALQVRELQGDAYYALSDMGQLSYFYASNGQIQKGIDIAKKGIIIAEKGKQLPKLIYLYSALAENYKAARQPEDLAETLLTIIELKDSLYQNNSARAIADLEGKYEYQKNENTIIQQHYALTQSRYVTFGLGALLALSILLFVSLYKNYQHVQKRKLNTMLIEQKRISEAAIHTAEERERKRIAADLHDNLGAHAAAISSGVKYFKEGIYDQKEIISQLDENASGMVNHLNDTIWVLKNERLYFTNLADRFKLWLQRLLLNYPDIRYHLIEDIKDDIEFTPNKILHLFLMLKESVNNAIKHSKCTDLSIHFLCNGHWEIIIEDNGIGFNIERPDKGNGIENMRQRAAECGWTLIFENRETTGTRVILSGSTTIN